MSTYHPIIPRADLPTPTRVTNPEIGIGLNEASSDLYLMVLDHSIALTPEQVLHMVRVASYNMDEDEFQTATAEIRMCLDDANPTQNS